MVRLHNPQYFLKQRLIVGGLDGSPAHRSVTGIGARALGSIRLDGKSLNLTKRCWCTSSMYQYMEQQAAATSPNPRRCPSSSADHTWTADREYAYIVQGIVWDENSGTEHCTGALLYNGVPLQLPKPPTEDYIAIPSGSIIFVRLRATMGSETIWLGCPGHSRRKTEIGWYYSNKWCRYLNMVSC